MKATFTITQFCDDHNISRTHFYELVKQGKGPRLLRVGRRTLVSQEAAADWRRRMEEETASQGKSFWEGKGDPSLLIV